MAKKKKTSPRAPRRRWPLWLAIGAIVIIAAAVGAYLWAGKTYQGERVRVYIPAGSTDQAVADSLRSALGTDYGSRVAALLRLQGYSPRTARGSYAVEPGSKALTVSRNIARGRQTPVKIVFNNVRTLQQLAQRVSARMDFSESDFIAACDSVLPELGFKGRAEYPAAFLPDSYEAYWTESAPAVVKLLAAYRNKFWTDQRREQARALGLTPVQVATVASIIEEETAKADERPKVARLYLNRIKKGMPLQADPTVKFAVGDFSLRRILAKHLQTESPYNTYRHAGMPPGPIRVAERQAIDDVLNAPAHGYLYMCAKEDFSGYHNFATDYATHLANARRYQAELNKRGIK